MARDRRAPRTPTTAPGRTPRRLRSLGRTGPATGVAGAPEGRRLPGGLRLPKPPRGWGLTPRALVVLSLVILLALSFANSLRIYVNQQHDLGVALQQIEERSDRIAVLEDELKRWDDPAYVKAQARARLGWVVPGEVGYRVIGPDGLPLGGGVVIESEATLPPGEHDQMWFDRIWGSIETADAPKRRLG